MPYQPLPARLITVTAHQPQLTAMWDGCTASASARLHAARRRLGVPVPASEPEPPLPELVRGWEGTCERCGGGIPWDDRHVTLGGGVIRIWDTASGQPEPGDLFWVTDYQGHCFHWDNCPGRHLHAVLPNGHTWDIDSRAANCNRPDDRVHRCWVRTGEPPRVTAGKGGDTCSAGAGSIVAGDYHGFLTDGVFTAG